METSNQYQEHHRYSPGSNSSASGDCLNHSSKNSKKARPLTPIPEDIVPTSVRRGSNGKLRLNARRRRGHNTGKIPYPPLHNLQPRRRVPNTRVLSWPTTTIQQRTPTSSTNPRKRTLSTTHSDSSGKVVGGHLNDDKRRISPHREVKRARNAAQDEENEVVAPAPAKEGEQSLEKVIAKGTELSLSSASSMPARPSRLGMEHVSMTPVLVPTIPPAPASSSIITPPSLFPAALTMESFLSDSFHSWPDFCDSGASLPYIDLSTEEAVATFNCRGDSREESKIRLKALLEEVAFIEKMLETPVNEEGKKGLDTTQPENFLVSIEQWKPAVQNLPAWPYFCDPDASLWYNDLFTEEDMAALNSRGDSREESKRRLEALREKAAFMEKMLETLVNEEGKEGLGTNQLEGFVASIRHAAEETKILREQTANLLEGTAQANEFWARLEEDPLVQPVEGPRDEASTGEKLIRWLKALFCNEERYRKLLSLGGSRAQTLVNLLQRLLDSVYMTESSFRKELIVTLQRFAKKADVYPTSYQVKENVTIQQEHYTGSGGFGDIYRCHLAGRKVCVKVIKMSSVSKGENFMNQCKKEAILWAQLSHQNIVPFLGFLYYSNRPCLLSPWMSNGHITDYLEKNPSFNRYLLVKDMTEGLHYLHSWGIVHGDLKGANVMVDDLGRARLTDFGISSVFDIALPHWTSQSTVASKGGSTRWQAPELLDSNDDKDVYNTIMSDVYAWACTCYEAFTSKLPFHEILREFTVMLRVTKDGLRPSRPLPGDPAWLVWGLQEQLWTLMERCWVKNPEERPSVEELLTTSLLVDALDDRPISIQSSSDYRTRRSAKTNLPTPEELERLLFCGPCVGRTDDIVI